MAKPTKYAPNICTGVSVAALIGIIIGLVSGNAIWPIIFLFPAAIYEAYRTEGKSTKTASIGLIAILILELGLILFNINFNLAEYLNTSQESIGGYLVPLGDIKIVGPTLLAILSVILFTNTRGIYTRWLATVVFITSFAAVYTIDPGTFHKLFRYALQEGLQRI